MTPLTYVLVSWSDRKWSFETIDPTTGHTQLLIGSSREIEGLAFNPANQTLYGVENNIPQKEVADALNLKPEQVERAWKDLVRKREATRHLRELPPAPEFAF